MAEPLHILYTLVRVFPVPHSGAIYTCTNVMGAHLKCSFFRYRSWPIGSARVSGLRIRHACRESDNSIEIPRAPIAKRHAHILDHILLPEMDHGARFGIECVSPYPNCGSRVQLFPLGQALLVLVSSYGAKPPNTVYGTHAFCTNFLPSPSQTSDGNHP